MWVVRNCSPHQWLIKQSADTRTIGDPNTVLSVHLSLHLHSFHLFSIRCFLKRERERKVGVGWVSGIWVVQGGETVIKVDCMNRTVSIKRTIKQFSWRLFSLASLPVMWKLTRYWNGIFMFQPVTIFDAFFKICSILKYVSLDILSYFHHLTLCFLFCISCALRNVPSNHKL